MIKLSEVDYLCVEDELDNSILKAKKIYFEGGVFIYPTDTIYGLGANPFNDEAVEKVNNIKDRQNEKNYILVVDSIDTLSKYVELDSEKHLDFLISIWPNPVSVVLKLNQKTNNILKLETAAFRIPNHRFCQRLTTELHMPLISTSVNRSGFPPINHPELIKQEFSSDVSGIFYSNKKYIERASTLIDLTGNDLVLLREGKVKFSELNKKFHQGLSH
jgi:L-threonylcarbamoyladenylate synthase